jgi:hypothetical protein
MNDHPYFSGLLGTSASFGGVFVSLLPHIETGIRIASLSVGLAVGIATLVHMVRQLRK